MTPADDSPGPDPSSSFDDLLAGLARRDEAAAREVHRRYAPRLAALARQRFGPVVRGKADPESAVQSALGSFFRRFDAGEFRLGSWDDLWGLLAVITMRKSAARARYHRRECRDAAREVPLGVRGEPESSEHLPPDPGPTPLDAAVLAETFDQLLGGLAADDRRIIELLLAGHTVEEVRSAVGCGERTVRRVRDRVRQKLRRIDESLG